MPQPISSSAPPPSPMRLSSRPPPTSNPRTRTDRGVDAATTSTECSSPALIVNHHIISHGGSPSTHSRPGPVGPSGCSSFPTTDPNPSWQSTPPPPLHPGGRTAEIYPSAHRTNETPGNSRQFPPTQPPTPTRRNDGDTRSR